MRRTTSRRSAAARRSSASRGKTRRASAFTRASAHVNTRGLLSPQGYCTPVKTRILAGGVHTAKQQIVRIDRVVSSEYDAKSRAAFTRAALKAAADCDAILLSDYGTGLVTPELAAALGSKVAAARGSAARFPSSSIRATTC